jgi:hypothetical protein
VQLAELGFEMITGEQFRVIADILLPEMKVVDPVCECRDFSHESPLGLFERSFEPELNMKPQEINRALQIRTADWQN